MSDGYRSNGVGPSLRPVRQAGEAYFLDQDAFQRLRERTPLRTVIGVLDRLVEYASENEAGTAVAYAPGPSPQSVHSNGQDLLDGKPERLREASLDALLRETMRKRLVQPNPHGRATYDCIDGAVIIEGDSVAHTGYHFKLSPADFLDYELRVPNGIPNWQRSGHAGQVNTRHLSSQAASYSLAQEHGPDTFVAVLNSGGSLTVYHDGRIILTKEAGEVEASRAARYHSEPARQDAYRRVA